MKRSLGELKVIKMPSLNGTKPSSVLRSRVWGVLTLLCVFSTLAVGQVRLLPVPREAHFAGETALPATIAVSVPGHFRRRDLDRNLALDVFVIRFRLCRVGSFCGAHVLPFTNRCIR